MKLVALGTLQTLNLQAIAVAPAVVEEPVTPIPIPQHPATDRAGDILPAPNKKRLVTVVQAQILLY